ncbi:hypothetical protein GGR28_003782 [Lewinella aquimaris]|uniref:Uncharacterized protein n=1 Tax=Neolewinella aquimaris TaxID=1835722 RepID=A0A840EC96_9BACT|nr:hypothetical protein [Neolewinella aquimaris]MBB4081135.1 hypothetical protein [Neolewinella aquimaris]
MKYSDDQQLVSISWLELKPNEQIGGNIESFEDYYNRLRMKHLYSHIPKEVYEQWICPLHSNCDTRENYGWINYRYATFDLVEIESELIPKLNVIPGYRSYVHDLSELNSYNDFKHSKQDVKHWMQNRSWRVPPIVLDCSTVDFGAKPQWSHIEGEYQLIEGHSRVGYWKAINKFSNGSLSFNNTRHFIWMMKCNQTVREENYQQTNSDEFYLDQI